MTFHRNAGIVVSLLLGIGVVPLAVDGSHFGGKSGFIPAAHAQSVIANMLARLRGERMPPGVVKSNGRMEATQVTVSSKYAGRLTEVFVEEGSNVTKGQVVAVISSPEYEAQLRASQANFQHATDALAAAQAEISLRQSAVDYARSDLNRAQKLIAGKTGAISQQAFEQSKRNFEVATSSLKAATAQRDQAQSAIKSAKAEVDRIQSVLHDLTLVSPRTGRVQYELAHSGEVVATGAPIVTILDLTDVYMTIFLPGADATKLELGGEARIVLDAVPNYVIPATVSFVAAEAQFTPKTVETQDERTKLMFRVKLKVDPDVLRTFYRRVKTGVRGMGIVRTDPATVWPADLQVKLPAPK